MKDGMGPMPSLPWGSLQTTLNFHGKFRDAPKPRGVFPPHFPGIPPRFSLCFPGIFSGAGSEQFWE